LVEVLAEVLAELADPIGLCSVAWLVKGKLAFNPYHTP
jgi:hypothetical protein